MAALAQGSPYGQNGEETFVLPMVPIDLHENRQPKQVRCLLVSSVNVNVSV